MREIKFRCWDTGINFMYYDPECYNIYNEEDNGLHSGYEDKYGTWHQNKLMQYTGLKDKNGVEIYEGDIVRVKFNNVQLINGEVSFDRGCFMWYQMPQRYGTELIGLVHESEVIGNIYENHELLDNE